MTFKMNATGNLKLKQRGKTEITIHPGWSGYPTGEVFSLTIFDAGYNGEDFTPSMRVDLSRADFDALAKSMAALAERTKNHGNLIDAVIAAEQTR